MSETELSKLQDKEFLGALAAIKRAAHKAREIAVRTNTGIVTHRPGEGIVKTSAEELRQAGYK